MGVDMKKYLFLCLVSFLVILVLIYFYNKREFVVSKVYVNNNLYIKYPYFNNKEIDNYISNYLYKIVIGTDYRYKYYINYKYSIDGNSIILTINDYKYYDNIYNHNSNCFNIDVYNSLVKRVSCYG